MHLLDSGAYDLPPMRVMVTNNGSRVKITIEMFRRTGFMDESLKGESFTCSLVGTVRIWELDRP
jgi:hypothetical protein